MGADALVRLTSRLLHGTHPRHAEALRARSHADGIEAALLYLERAGAVRRTRVTTLRQLASLTGRAVCILHSGRSVLLETDGGADWTVDTGDGSRPGRIRPAALASLFPCEALFSAEAAKSHGGGAEQDTAGGARLSVALRLTAQILGLATPIAMMLIIDKVVSQGAQNTLIALLIGVAMLTVFQYLFVLGHALHAIREAEVLALPARQRVFERLLASSQAVGWASVGWDVIQGASDTGRFAVETRPQMLADWLYMVLLAVLMASFSPLLLAVSLAFIPAYVLVESVASHRAERHAVGATELRSALSTEYFEAVGAADLLQTMALGPHVTGRWAELDGRLAGSRYRLALCRRLSSLGVEFLQKVSLIAIMLLGVSSVIAGVMTLGQYIAFNLLSMQLAQPALRLAAYRRSRADDRLYAQSRRQVERACEEHAWPSGGELRPPAQEALVLAADGLLVRPDGPEIGFVLRGGLWLGIVGASGCGKTTLLRTLAGLHESHRGTVRLNGVPIQHLDPVVRSRALRLVPQQAVVFSVSIAENIRLGDLAASPAQVLSAARVCGLGPLLERLPEHLNTRVGPAGWPLSGGERQRVAMARAILGHPQVLLLDEATAALDAPGEAELLENLRRHLPDCAVVVVAHRRSSLAGCRQVLRLDVPQDAAVADRPSRPMAGVA